MSDPIRKCKIQKITPYSSSRENLPINKSKTFSNIVRQANFELISNFLNEYDCSAVINVIDDHDYKTPLMFASFNGLFNIVQLLLESEADIDASGDEYFVIIDGNQHSITTYTPLMLACYNGHVQIVHLLINGGANINAQKSGYSPLLLASEGGHLEIVHLLLNNGADINQQNGGFTSLMLAIYRCHFDVAFALLNRGASAAFRGSFGSTALLLVFDHFNKFQSHLRKSRRNDVIELVQQLVNCGAEINVQNDNGNSPLHLATRFAVFFAPYVGFIDVMKLLLDSGADTNIKDKCGETAINMATDNGNPCNPCRKEIVDLLLNYGADPNIKNRNGKSVIMIAACRGRADLVETLIHHGAEVNVIDKMWTALEIAICSGYKNVVEVLLNNGADISDDSGSRDTALTLARKHGHSEIIRLIEEFDPISYYLMK